MKKNFLIYCFGDICTNFYRFDGVYTVIKKLGPDAGTFTNEGLLENKKK